MLQTDTRYHKKQYSQSRKDAANYTRRKWLWLEKKRLALRKKRENKNKKVCSSRQLKKRRDEYQQKSNLLKDKQGNIIGEEGKIKDRWAEHFTEMLNNKHEGLLYLHAAQPEMEPLTNEGVEETIA